MSAAHATFSNVVSAASSLPPRRHHRLGHTRTLIQANMEKQISGSDVLWALQRASARNKKKKKKEEYERGREDSSSALSRMEEIPVDYTNVRPLCINDHWGPKLDELEKRLRHLQEDIL